MTNDLFDTLRELAEVEAELARLKTPNWHEAPQSRFLNWSPQMQNAYCAARDRNSAATAENDQDVDKWWRNFYEERAAWYE